MHSVRLVEQPETKCDQIAVAALEVLDPVETGREKQGAARDLVTCVGK